MKENLTIKQQIIDYLAYMKVMTRPYMIGRALKDQEYAKEIITGNGLIQRLKLIIFFQLTQQVTVHMLSNIQMNYLIHLHLLLIQILMLYLYNIYSI